MVPYYSTISLQSKTFLAYDLWYNLWSVAPVLDAEARRGGYLSMGDIRVQSD
jgi:hypothetical protein